MEEMTNYTIFLPGKLNETDRVEQTDNDRKISKWILEKQGVKVEDWSERVQKESNGGHL
jgi:hypothetical protein